MEKVLARVGGFSGLSFGSCTDAYKLNTFGVTVFHDTVSSFFFVVCSHAVLSLCVRCVLGRPASVSPPPAAGFLDVRLHHQWVKELVYMLPKDYRTPDHVLTVMHWAVRFHASEHPLRNPVYSTLAVNRRACRRGFVCAV